VTVPTVGSVMTVNVVVAHPAARFKHIVESLTRNRIGCVPVVDERRRVLGVISESDLLRHLAGDRPHRWSAWFRRPGTGPVTASQLMTSPAVTVRPDDPLLAAAHRALAARVHRMPVVDDAGVLVGVVSRADLLRAYLRSDASLAADVRALVQQLSIDPATVQVEVSSGVVRLSGRLEWAAIGSQLAEQAAALPGVVSVENCLTAPAGIRP